MKSFHINVLNLLSFMSFIRATISYGQQHSFQPYRGIRKTPSKNLKTATSMTHISFVKGLNRHNGNTTFDLSRQKINKSVKVIDLSNSKPNYFHNEPFQTPPSLSRKPSIEALIQSHAQLDSIGNDLSDFNQGILPEQPDKEEYLRVWFENMALKQRLKKVS